MTDQAVGGAQAPRINLLKVLGPVHVWALGVGIVLVGEFMGWNFSVGKGGAFGSLIACWVIGLLYTCVAMIDTEVTRSEEHTSELQSLMRISYAVFCLKKKKYQDSHLRQCSKSET